HTRPDQDVDVNDTLPHKGGAGQHCLTNLLDALDGYFKHAHMEKLLPQKRCQKAADDRGQEAVSEQVHDSSHWHFLLKHACDQVDSQQQEDKFLDDGDLLSNDRPEITAADLPPGSLRLKVVLADFVKNDRLVNQIG